jgi:hypothetical protein
VAAISLPFGTADVFTVTGAPGISIKTVLTEAPEAALREYVGPATINVLSALSPELLTRHNLIELAVEAAEPLLGVCRSEDEDVWEWRARLIGDLSLQSRNRIRPPIW